VAARAVADKALKPSAYSALWLFVSLLTGAFVASLAATFGGRHIERLVHPLNPTAGGRHAFHSSAFLGIPIPIIIILIALFVN